MKWLVDEMLPPSLARELNALGHDASSVVALGLTETPDETIYNLAVEQQRVVVTGNFADFANLVNARYAGDEPCVPVVFVRKRYFPRGGALATHLARHLHAWAKENPTPFPGLHWP